MRVLRVSYLLDGEGWQSVEIYGISGMVRFGSRMVMVLSLKRSVTEKNNFPEERS